jgi:phenylpropionate dioxygenase-like ring-hydroxylating dioxygenase large terminal subunit
MTYLRNTWYVAAWASELADRALVARTLLEVPVVLFRTSHGEPAALLDRCPHRFLPLSMGMPTERGVQCAYHGLEFDGSGKCVGNPFSDVIPKAAKVATFPVVERHSLIWIWMGEVAAADPALIPDFSCMDPDTAWVGKRYLHVKANYVLETDNIMDLSHIEFLHPTTLGSGSVRQGEVKVEMEGDSIWSRRRVRQEILPDYMYGSMGLAHGVPVERRIDVRWDAPAVMLLITQVTPEGGTAADTRRLDTAHLFTPETATTSHYWYSASLPKADGPGGETSVERRVAGLALPFETEDLPVLEAQQRAMGDADFWDLKPVLLPGDAAAVRARRMLEQRIREEASDPPAVAPQPSQG